MQNKIIDWWSVIHFIGGFSLASFPRNYMYPLFIIFEIAENTIGPRLNIIKEIEGPVAIASDMLINIASYELGRKYGHKKI